MGRAIAHQRSPVARFADPAALPLLAQDARALVERIRKGLPPRTLRERFSYAHLGRLSALMVARTLAIDDAIVAAHAPQVVILGAGLDGRAYRMPELRDAIVFEVDHPDTQRDKRARAAALTATAREVRFVAIDFTRDALDAELDKAGHDPRAPTTWVWEGVVMYLTVAQIEATLEVIARRSLPGSTLVILYSQPSALSKLTAQVVKRLGEPFRSAFRPEQMRALLAKHGFTVRRDLNIADAARELDPALGETIRMITHLRLVVAPRPSS